MRGRTVVLLGLLAFVIVAVGVVWRRTIGVAQARTLRDLRETRSSLVASEAALEGAIRDASSRAQLERIAEQRLGLRIPSESLVIRLPRPRVGEAR